jgi:hypothetical protein
MGARPFPRLALCRLGYGGVVILTYRKNKISFRVSQQIPRARPSTQKEEHEASVGPEAESSS